MTDREKLDVKRLINCLYNRTDERLIKQLAYLLSYEERQLEKDIETLYKLKNEL